ncbi:putative receptor protein kinase ZmPK1 isoform X2 [Miscanthus floridulus]
MVLTDYDGTVVWQTNTSSKGADYAELMDSGNLVMKDQGGNILWQSFDHPTDTLLPTQPVTASAKLVSTDLSHPSSYYTLLFDDRYILSLAYDGPDISNLYWPNPDFSSWLNYRISYNSSRRGVLDNLGQFTASDNTSFVSADWGPGVMRRLTLDYDGNLRLYSLNDSDGRWLISWMAFSQPCEIHGICGWNGICVYTPVPACSCPPGYVVRDPTDWSKGCIPKFNLSCSGDQQMGFVSLPQTDFWGSDLDYIPMTSLDACTTLCLDTCSCLAFEYKSDSNGCFLKSVLLNGKTVPGYPGTAHLKVPQSFLSETISYVPQNSEILDCNASSAKLEVLVFNPDAHSNGNSTMWHYYYGFLAALFLIEVCFIAFGWWFMARKQSTQLKICEEGYRMVTDHFRNFTYKELREATKNFKDGLGHGRYGSVYKGILHDKRVVAVKKLGDVKQGEDEFQTEVSVIGRIYHMNLVRVRGVCSERKHRLLVIEYVDNGSLAMFLFGNHRLLQWDQRYKIAVGVAKGLAYLHHECLDWIIHCDLKPENILLDQDFEPKISDFGVAKLLQRDQTDPNMSKVRGTRGYAAPEWASSIPINEKVDVYSYGVVLIELVIGRRASELAATGTGDAEVGMRQLVWTIREKLKSGDLSWIIHFVDPKLNGNIVHSEVLLMLEVAAMCLEKERSQRPSMNDIVEKLQFRSCNK